jgi:tetratricopeptide (TPR) repeat protein
VDEARSLLQTTLDREPGDSEAHQLMCRVYYSEDMADPAVHECELAVELGTNPSLASDNRLWLGRAYGLKAGHANVIIAFGLAKRVRVAFEQAVELDGNNVHALSDLGQYYATAPGIVGGGTDKALAVAAKMESRFPSQAHRLRAFAAVSNKDYATAEAEFRAEVAAGRRPEAYVDLAAFYADRRRADDAMQTLQKAVAADASKDAALVDVASILTEIHRSPDLAMQLLRAYLSSPAKTEEAPAFKVHRQLAGLLAKSGDQVGQQREIAAALALASGYKPAHSSSEGM